MQANKDVGSSPVTRASSRKGKVHRQTLKLLSSRLGSVWTGRFLALFSLDTGGTAMEIGVMVFERWDTNDKLVGIIQVLVPWV
jgi:hypothetical protein